MEFQLEQISKSGSAVENLPSLQGQPLRTRQNIEIFTKIGQRQSANFFDRRRTAQHVEPAYRRAPR
jgi:hypothetical protein